MLKKFFGKLLSPTPSKPRRSRQPVTTKGELYDLQEIYDHLNARYFNNEVEAKIMWCGSKDARPRTRIRLGSYYQDKREIKIHRILDQEKFPDYYVFYIVYHEMLHHVLPPIKGKKRRQIHHPAFIAREKQFHDFQKVETFSKTLTQKLFSFL